MSSKERTQADVEVIGFKNAKFVGQARKNQKGVKLPEGFGALMDDLYLTCIGNWRQKGTKSLPVGPAILLYPKRQIFYTSRYPSEGAEPELWCYVFQNEGIRIFGHGKSSNFAVLTNIQNQDTSSVVCLTAGQNGYSITNQYMCKNTDDLWSSVKSIIGLQVPNSYRSVQNFLHLQLSKSQISKNSIIIREGKKGDLFYGIFCKNNQGFGFLMNKNQNSISEFGFYQDTLNASHLQFGRKFSSRHLNAVRIDEGIFIGQDNQLDEKIYAYYDDEKRPQESYKTSQKYFRQTEEYSNQFIQLSEADQLYKEVNEMILQFTRLSQIQNGQRILEQGPRRELRRKAGTNSAETQEQKRQKERKEKERIQQEKKQSMTSNRQYDLNEAKAIIELEVSKKKGKYGTDRTYRQLKTESLRDRSGDRRRRSQERSRSRSRSIQRINSPYTSKRQAIQRYKNPYLDSNNRSSPQKGASPVKYLYLNEQLKNQKLRLREGSGSFNRNIRKQSQGRPTIKQFTVDDETNRIKQRSKYQMDRYYAAEPAFSQEQQQQLLDRQKILQISLMKQKQIVESMSLLETLRRREQEEQLRYQINKKQFELAKAKRIPTFGTFGTIGLPLHESSSINQGFSGKVYGKVKYIPEETVNDRERSSTPLRNQNVNAGRTNPINRSPSPYAPRTTAARRPFKYVD